MYKINRNSNFDETNTKIPFFRKSKITSMMKTDIQETNDTYKIYIDMPGFEKEDIKLTTEEDYIEIYATRLFDEKYPYIHQERFFGDCYRKIFISNGDKNKINAVYKQGVLTLVVYKKSKIEIN